MTKNSTFSHSDLRYAKVNKPLQSESKKGRSTDGTWILKMISPILYKLHGIIGRNYELRILFLEIYSFPEDFLLLSFHCCIITF